MSQGGLYRKNEDKVDLICIHFYCSHRRDYKSEYKQRFRPFSQYEYLGDGRFVTNANGNGQVTPPVCTASKIKQQLALQPKATSLHGEPWYREVVELRKQANDYKVCMYSPSLKSKAKKGMSLVVFILSVLWSSKSSVTERIMREVPAEPIDTVTSTWTHSKLDEHIFYFDFFVFRKLGISYGLRA